VNKRTKNGQKKHGFTTNADLPGWNKPKKIRGFIPDLIAKKGKKEIILEVETKNTDKSDAEQQEAFKEYSKRGKERTFRKKIL